MKLNWLTGRSLRALVAGALAGGILHICTTLAIPYTSVTGAYAKLEKSLQKNQMTFVAPPSADNQLLPFMTPEIRYAFCRFDISREPVRITATLLNTSWTLALYSPHGDNFYIATGSPARPLNVAFNLVPPGEKFLGLFRTAHSLASDKVQVEVPSKQGLVVIRAPINGTAFVQEVEATLRRSSCQVVDQ